MLRMKIMKGEKCRILQTVEAWFVGAYYRSLEASAMRSMIAMSPSNDYESRYSPWERRSIAYIRSQKMAATCMARSLYVRFSSFAYPNSGVVAIGDALGLRVRAITTLVSLYIL